MTLISNVSGMNGRRGAGGARGVAVEMRALEGNQEDAANPMKIDFPPSLSFALSVSHLDSGLGEADLHGEVLPREDVRVVRRSERLLQLLQLGETEIGCKFILKRSSRERM